MFYKGIILDLDNTLYSYTNCHLNGLNSALEYISSSVNISKDVLQDCYNNVSIKLKNELGPTASSHNKFIYFKQLLETLNQSGTFGFSDKVAYALIKANEIYWDVFYNNLNCYNGVKDFIAWNKENNIKIGILTDYETEYQIIKLHKLGLLQYIDVIVTSEEIGVDKPSTKMFCAILAKMGLSSNEVIMIGDNYNKDIKFSGCYSLLFNENDLLLRAKEAPDWASFSDWALLLREFQSYYDDINKLVYLSKRCGERFDLVQAGGGNISVKSNTRNLMFIKSSGCHLSALSLTDSYSVIDNATGNKLFGKQASIETSMHSMLKKYTIHLHPIAVNRVLVCSNATEIINKIYPESLIIEYLTPGLKVSAKLLECYNGENVIFLLNHGIIVTSDSYNDLLPLIDSVVSKFETYLSLDYSHYKATNIISQSLNPQYVTYLCEDSIINNGLKDCKNFVSFPDALIYCGKTGTVFSPREQSSRAAFSPRTKEATICPPFGRTGKLPLNPNGSRAAFSPGHNETPTVIFYENRVYIHNKNIYKCKDTEDVLKSIIYINNENPEITYLTDDEQYYLLNWDAEKYRQNV